MAMEVDPGRGRVRSVAFGDPAGQAGGGRLGRREALAAGAGAALPGLARLAAAAPGLAIAVSPEQLRPGYDHVVVGAGSAGAGGLSRPRRGGDRRSA
jgi:hypothetical protein